MGANNLTVVGAGKILIAHVNQFFTALSGDFLPRNAATGALEDNVRKLGRPAFRWKEAHITDLFLGGSLFNPDAVGIDQKFAIVSGASRTDSAQADFLRADGAGATATILATTTPLQITANDTSVIITADIALAALTVAPAANNTALVDDAALTGGNETKFTGEDFADPITIDTVGTEISNRIGEYICLKTPTGEFMLAFVEDATTLNRCFRGFFFDDTGVPVVRGVLSNNDTLTIMSLGWVFVDKNGTTTDVSYTSPIYSGVEPSAPVLDDYWFDLLNRLWKRFDGADFVQVDRMLIGLVVIDTVNAVVARSFDFTKNYQEFLDLELEIGSVTTVKTQKGYSRVSVYAQTQELYAGAFVWDITADRETGVAETADTQYFIYLTEEGIPQISDERPYDRESELKGFYHPYHTWRCVGTMFNDSGSDIVSVAGAEDKGDEQTFDASGTWIKPKFGTMALIQLWGGGGGGSNAASGRGGGGGGAYSQIWILLSDLEDTETVTIGAGGATETVGGSSTFGVHLTAFGGGAAHSSTNSGGGGGGGQDSAGSDGAAINGGDGGEPAGGDGGVGAGVDGEDGFSGGGGGASNSGSTGGDGGDSHYGGGGGAGGGTTGGKGGGSIYGGAGGGASGGGSAGGDSVYGGDGGDAAVAGSVPGGGGGGNASGGSGRCTIRVY